MYSFIQKDSYIFCRHQRKPQQNKTQAAETYPSAQMVSSSDWLGEVQRVYPLQSKACLYMWMAGMKCQLSSVNAEHVVDRGRITYSSVL
jgi:hypothetical protein